MKSLAERLRYISRKMRGKYSPVGADAFFKEVKGVIHIGANIGQERFFYLSNKISVLWIEPIPEVFYKLSTNIKKIPNQRALNYLISDIDNQSFDFHITDNDGESSSLFQLDKHKLLWPEVNHSRTIQLMSTRLDSMLAKEKIDVYQYDALVIDTQGAELLALRGADSIIQNFKYIKLEVADFESYVGNCTLDDISRFMTLHQFSEHNRTQFAQHEVGSYYDITYKRISS
jgi:FkbM family methyltransferase